jgi:hypothetical protein
MASRAAVAVLVVCLVAAPGCNALGGSDAEPVETLTPVPVTADGSTPTSTPAPQSGSLPPGVSLDGTVDVDRLVAAHESALADRTYRWKFSYDVAGETQSSNSNITWVALIGNEAFLVEQTSPGPSANRSLFVADGAGYLRSVRNESVRFRAVERPGDHYSLAFSGAILRRFLTGVTVDVTTVEVDGRTYYRLYAADSGVPTQLRWETVAVQDYTVTAYVTPDGFVRTVAVEYDRVDRLGYSRVTARYDYTDLDGVTVERPNWTSPFRPTGPSSTGTGTVTPTEDSPTEGSPTEDSPTEDSPTENGTATPGTETLPVTARESRRSRRV